MDSVINPLLRLRYLTSFSRTRVPVLPSVFFTSKAATCSTVCQAEAEVEEVTEEQRNMYVTDDPESTTEVFKKWGCSDIDITKLFTRRPSLQKADPLNIQFKLNVLNEVGLDSNDLVKIVNCRPRFLSSRINLCFEERIEYLTRLFGSREMLCKAIVRNPSLLTYDLENKIKPVVALYEELGISRSDLIPMLMSRPTLIPRTSLDDQKMEYINKTGVSKVSKMYKYIVTLIAVSRVETIREKVANLEKFGISEDEIWLLFGKSPLLLTLSVEKIQRNMTFVVGTMRMPAKVILEYPFLLFNNLEAVLRPRLVLAAKIEDMGLVPELKGFNAILRALRMSENRFLKVFVQCQPQDIAAELMAVFLDAKSIKRLAATSKKNIHKGFPF